TLAALVTSRLEIGTLVASPNFRHPVAFSRDLTGLDEISEGRLTLGVGAGATGGYDVDVFGAGAPKSRVRRFDEFVELLDRLLREDHVSFRGDYYSAVDARSVPGVAPWPRAQGPFSAPRSVVDRIAADVLPRWRTSGND
ncbi:LLM class flavin-dependent oxidoreductase, partial [Streptomyces yerevanensis]|uniref:LLM class flavin-dependent oxidoreductase n=1 Tax=Streptomyces yerevanensis TaxID=66378 RepID=UPI00052797F2